jgi:hypothetical protein
VTADLAEIVAGAIAMGLGGYLVAGKLFILDSETLDVLQCAL